MKSIDYDQSGFSARCKSWVDEGVPFRIEVKGWKGKVLAKALGLDRKGPGAVVETTAIVAAVVSVAALAAFTAIMLYSIKSGYQATGRAEPDGTVVIDCKPA